MLTELCSQSEMVSRRRCGSLADGGDDAGSLRAWRGQGKTRLRTVRKMKTTRRASHPGRRGGVVACAGELPSWRSRRYGCGTPQRNIRNVRKDTVEVKSAGRGCGNPWDRREWGNTAAATGGSGGRFTRPGGTVRAEGRGEMERGCRATYRVKKWQGLMAIITGNRAGIPSLARARNFSARWKTTHTSR